MDVDKIVTLLKNGYTKEEIEKLSEPAEENGEAAGENVSRETPDPRPEFVKTAAQRLDAIEKAIADINQFVRNAQYDRLKEADSGGKPEGGAENIINEYIAKF